MKKFALLIVTLIFVELANAQITFQKAYGVLGEVGQSVKQTFDGGYIITGYTVTNAVPFNMDVFLMKTDMYGDTLWVKAFGGSDEDVGYSVEQTSDSGYIVAGYTSSFGAGDRDIYLIKTDANGNLLWSKTYGGAGSDNGYDVLQTFDGNFVITGSYNFVVGYAYFLLKVNSIGNVMWEKTFSGAAGRSVKQTSDSGFIITGNLINEIFLTKTDIGGNMIWSKSFGGGNYHNQGNCVEQTTDGGYIIGGYSNYDFQVNKYYIYLIKTNAIGDTLWTKLFSGSDDQRCYSIKQTTDGGYIIAGQVIGPFLDDVCLLKTDSTGNVQWSKSIGGALFDAGSSVGQTSDSGFVIAGRTNSFTSGLRSYLIKTDANGNSGCYDTSFTPINFLFTTQLFLPSSSIVSPAFTVNSATTIINSGGNVISFCLNTGINELTNKDAITIFPNPSTGHFIIELNNFRNYCKIEVYNMTGENVFTENISNESKKEINLKNISKGIYFVKVFNGEKMYSQKIIIN